MGSTTELRHELKKKFFPLAAEKGFSHDKLNRIFWNFRRITSDSVHVFNIQWEKYGSPRFTINYGKCSIRGVVAFGTVISADRVSAGDTPFQGRLQPKPCGYLSCWFRQDRPLLAWLVTRQRYKLPAEVVEQVLELFPELEVFWETGQLGPHMIPWPVTKGVQDAT